MNNEKSEIVGNGCRVRMASRPNFPAEPSINMMVGYHKPPRVSVDRDQKSGVPRG